MLWFFFRIKKLCELLYMCMLRKNLNYMLMQYFCIYVTSSQEILVSTTKEEIVKP